MNIPSKSFQAALAVAPCCECLHGTFVLLNCLLSIFLKKGPILTISRGNVYKELGYLYSKIPAKHSKAISLYESALAAYTRADQVPSCIQFKVIYENHANTLYEYAAFLYENNLHSKAKEILEEAKKMEEVVNRCPDIPFLVEFQKVFFYKLCTTFFFLI